MRYGGSPGVRDEGLLESAVAQAAATFGGEYLHNDIFQMAAAYLFHIVQNHPFVDGNKRTGATAAVVFLRMNDISIEADEAVFENLVRAAAEGQVGKTAIADFLRAHARPAE